MATPSSPEHWLRGPVPGIPSLLQPVAHALLQARDEVKEAMQNFPEHLLWEKPAGLASPGFHLQHLCGVLDRLFTYASEKSLSEDQFRALKAEGSPQGESTTAASLLAAFSQQIDNALEALRGFNEQSLLEKRGVGRAQLPSNVLGLLFHAAEHTMRHNGQLLVTAKILQAQENQQ